MISKITSLIFICIVTTQVQIFTICCLNEAINS